MVYTAKFLEKELRGLKYEEIDDPANLFDLVRAIG